MNRRRLLVGLTGITVGASTLIGSGAFTSVEADREITVEVADDPDAFLGLDACGVPSETPNDKYVSIEDSLLTITLSSKSPTAAGGEGVNADARTAANNVFQVENRGTNSIEFFFQFDAATTEDGEPAVQIYNDGNPDWVIDENSTTNIRPGDAQCVGIEVNTHGLSSGDQLIEDDTVTIVAGRN